MNISTFEALIIVIIALCVLYMSVNWTSWPEIQLKGLQWENEIVFSPAQFGAYTDQIFRFIVISYLG